MKNITRLTRRFAFSFERGADEPCLTSAGDGGELAGMRGRLEEKGRARTMNEDTDVAH